MYTVEAKEQDAKVQQFIADNREAWEVRKQVRFATDLRRKFSRTAHKWCRTPSAASRTRSRTWTRTWYVPPLTQHGLDDATKETDEYRSAVEALDKSKESP